MLFGPLAGKDRSWKAVSTNSKHRKERLLTLEEFFACVLLEKCFMSDGADQVVDHKPENG